MFYEYLHMGGIVRFITQLVDLLSYARRRRDSGPAIIYKSSPFSPFFLLCSLIPNSKRKPTHRSTRICTLEKPDTQSLCEHQAQTSTSNDADRYHSYHSRPCGHCFRRLSQWAIHPRGRMWRCLYRRSEMLHKQRPRGTYSQFCLLLPPTP